MPAYIINNINTVTDADPHPRKPLTEVPMEFLEKVIEKIDQLFNDHISNKISTFTTPPIHSSVKPEFTEPYRSEKSLRHLRQASSLLHIAEMEGLVRDKTCYVELGAGKGQLSYYLGVSWCQNTQSRVLSIDRAALRHKRDNLLRSERLKTSKHAEETNDSRDVTATDNNNQSKEQRGSMSKSTDKNCEDLNDKTSDIDGATGDSESEVAVRLRADLAHLALERVPVVADCERVVGFAKHLCGVAMDYALRCISSVETCAGAVLATCCHHRCERPIYVANHLLQNLGISPEEFNVMLSVVSWATCGDGRSRDHRKNNQQNENHNDTSTESNNVNVNGRVIDLKDHRYRETIGRKAKLLVDWGRVLYLKAKGFDARLCYYVPSTVSLENVCIVVKRSV